MKLSRQALPLPLFLFVLLASPVAAQVRREYTEVHMGMPVRAVLHAPNDSTARAAARAAFRKIAELEDIFSDYRAFSELRRLELSSGDWVTVSEPLFAVLGRALEIARATDGAFDPTIGPLSALWRDARRSGKLPSDSSLRAARGRVGWHRIELDSARSAVRLQPGGMRLDLGGIAKGYILERALGVLARHDVTAALLEAGGDILVGEAPPGQAGWTVTVPGADTAFRARAAALSHAALATSGASAQYLEVDGVRYSHVIDPRTGRALTTGWRAYVIGPNAMIADALATALTVLGPDAVARLTRGFAGTEMQVIAER